MNIQQSKYYVYTWTRLDTNQVFYVGKGSGIRAYRTDQRSKYFKKIKNKAECEVRLVFENLTESEAFIKEQELIIYYKSIGQAVANFTNGGEGVSGWTHSEKTREKMSKSQSNMTQERKDKIAAGNRGKKLSQETKDKISNSKKGKKRTPEQVARMKTRVVSEETKQKISAFQKNKIVSQETRLKISTTKQLKRIQRELNAN